MQQHAAVNAAIGTPLARTYGTESV